MIVLGATHFSSPGDFNRIARMTKGSSIRLRGSNRATIASASAWISLFASAGLHMCPHIESGPLRGTESKLLLLLLPLPLPPLDERLVAAEAWDWKPPLTTIPR